LIEFLEPSFKAMKVEGKLKELNEGSRFLQPPMDPSTFNPTFNRLKVEPSMD
jgi:hypothetical protein